jgi:iron(II)-dependent oxidoreductase
MSTVTSTDGRQAVTAIDREALAARYRRLRDRSRALFDLLTEDAYYTRPIALRHPIVFYEGHLPAFSFNTVVKKALGGASIDEQLERLFARGIDPDTPASTADPAIGAWPARSVVQRFAEEADRRVLDAISNADIERPGDPLLDRANALFGILEHEAMHQETLLYMWHRLPFEQKHAPDGYRPIQSYQQPAAEWMDVPQGQATLGVDRTSIPFGWDNEFPAHRLLVDAFAIERHDVTNAHYLEFVEAGGYQQEQWWQPQDWQWVQEESIGHPHFWERRENAWYWRAMFELLPLPQGWPVYVSQAEAAAYARWRGCRVATEGEFQRAAFGTPDGTERTHPWGTDPPATVHGVFDFVSWDPQPAGSHPQGKSAWGVEDLVGNGWEWTSTTFAPFPGFEPSPSYPEYSADFFDGQHAVMKGASPATDATLLRPTFRNWFRTRYPYVYATFRCVREEKGR